MSLKETCKHSVRCIIHQNWEGGLGILVSKISMQNKMPEVNRSIHSVFEEK